MTCARCKGPMKIPEKCWYCMSDICYDCWDEHGECGEKSHKERRDALTAKFDKTWKENVWPKIKGKG